jgi:hypothetical protein
MWQMGIVEEDYITTVTAGLHLKALDQARCVRHDDDVHVGMKFLAELGEENCQQGFVAGLFLYNGDWKQIVTDVSLDSAS